MEGVKCILLDIEGTVCPISFVKDTLFPYAIKALPAVLASQWNDDAFAPFRDAFPEQARASPAALQAHVEDLTKRDVKVAPLKNLQGYLWEDGYKSGAYATSLFPDVVPMLQQWKEEGYSLAIYSSGSVFAQKLLFGHVNEDEKGASSASSATQDLTGLFDGWFDTVNAGLKTESGSYSKIAGLLKHKPEEILFLSDNVKEVDAAHVAKMASIVVDRPGNAPLAEDDRSRLSIVNSLSDIKLPAR